MTLFVFYFDISSIYKSYETRNYLIYIIMSNNNNKVYLVKYNTAKLFGKNLNGIQSIVNFIKLLYNIHFIIF